MWWTRGGDDLAGSAIAAVIARAVKGLAFLSRVGGGTDAAD